MAERPPPGAAPPEPTRRLFFALWPDEAMREAMVRATHEAARASGGRPVPAQNLHVTLAFLGSVPERRLPQLTASARGAGKPVCRAGESPACDEPGVELAFDRLAYWRGAHVLCALPARLPAPLATLARRLQERLTEGGFGADPATPTSGGSNIARPFRPHATLARKAIRPPPSLEMEAVTWRFVEFVLVESRTHTEGAVYRVLESFTVGIE